MLKNSIIEFQGAIFLREISIIKNKFKVYDHKDLLNAYEILETLLLNFRIFKHFT